MALRTRRDWIPTVFGLVLLAGRMTSGSERERPGPRPEKHQPLLRKYGQLFPNHFAMVMATGIVSLDASMLGWRQIALALLAINIVAWILFWAAGAVRAASEPRSLARSLGHHTTGPAFLTLIAGTAVLASQFPSLHLATWVINPLFGLSLALWWVVIYGFLAGVSEGRGKPRLEHGLSGEWLLVVVATESLASLGADILGQSSGSLPGLAFVCYVLVLSGAVFYLFFGSVLLYRFAFVAMPPQDVSGPWWISEGASSIVVLAGCKLMALPGLALGAFSLRALLSPVMVMYWADAAFWIPLLVLLFAWKYLIRRQPLRYSSGLWAIVFPLGMFGAGTLELSSVFSLGLLHPLGVAFFWVALVAWGATFAGAWIKAGREIFV